MPEFKDIAAAIREKGKPKRMTVRALMKSIGQQRRGKNVNRKLRTMLNRAKLTTEPDFELVHIDSYVSLKALPESPTLRKVTIPVRKRNRNAPIDVLPVEPTEEEREVVLTIGQLLSANRKPVFLTRDESYLKATTLLIQERTDHLVVSQNKRVAEGLITWQSIGEACAGRKELRTAADCMEKQPLTVRYDTPLFDAVREITVRGFVLVQGDKGEICGSVTSRDIAEQFVTLSEPFLFLEQIENHLRVLLRGARLGQEAIRELTDPRDEARKARVKSVDDLTFGETLRAFEDSLTWDKLKLSLDRKTLCERLRRVSDIRNSVMHFHPDGITDEEREILRKTRGMLQII